MFGGWFPHTSEPSDFSNAEPPCSINGVILASFFLVPFIAFLIILPGVRDKRFVSLVTYTITMFVGAVLVASLAYPGWAVGHARIVSQFRAHTRERMLSKLGVDVGLNHLNITLRHDPSDILPQVFNENDTYFEDEHPYREMSDFFSGLVNEDLERSKVPNLTKLYFNERFDISGALRNAYTHGLPYPMLSVLEYFSLNQDAFDWGRHYRVAGHYTYAAMSLSLSFWALSIIFLLFLPHCYGGAQLACGLSSIGGIIIYLVISPAELLISFVGEDGHRTVERPTFFEALALLSIAFGLSLMLLQHFRLYTLSTFLDAQLDETVGPTKRRKLALQGTKIGGEDLASSLEVMRRAKASGNEPCSSSEHSKHSSGIHSRSSYTTDTASIHSSGSFSSVKSLSSPARNLTIRSRKSDEIHMQVEKL